ncbi:hypothetical protein [Candidatus Cyanaurora vandensis]|uniref:hypothetical protein n=1 Tax=Candidatus Cyanaurora vandensis TaxID=2714958 RepID=UPI00257DA38A|nr:hypothetical protein [Candidatus Cyanaurora vandensis]
MANAPFPIRSDLTAIAIAYKNQDVDLIADKVMPIVPVGKQEFEWILHTLEESYTVPDTSVGRKGRPNEVDFSAQRQASFTLDYGLDDPIPQNDIDNAPPNYDPLGRAAEGLMDLILLDREVRVSNLVFNDANYLAANIQDLSAGGGVAQFNNDAANPIKTIQNAMNQTIMRPNIMVIGRDALTGLASNPFVVQAYNRNAGSGGIVPEEFIANLFGLQELLIGEARINRNAKGQAANIQRAWGKNISLLYRNRVADNLRGMTWGFTAQWGTRFAGSKPDSGIGLMGGQRVRAGMRCREVVAAAPAGFYLKNVVV